MITESNMSIMPHAMRRVITSPNSIMPSTAAVTGSSAPIMAVGVEPMQRMAMAINTSDMTVGTRPRVSEKGVTIQGRTARGVFYGLMTFDQLLRGNGTSACCESIPQLRIIDQPRTHIRELMLDPCRTFIPFDELKAFVPEMARYKYNTIHLHLTDDQAWRIEDRKSVV